MQALENIYGMHCRDEWALRLGLPLDHPLRNNLSDTRESSAEIAIRPATHVTSFVKLVDLVAFLSVMNKGLVLLFRGQRHDSPLRPTLFRETWRSSLARDSEPLPLAGARMDYWTALASVESMVLRVLQRHGLPRWRHLRDYPEARWAVIQHYEIWPTPLLDFTSSLRVASSFAFGCDRKVPEGYLYVVGVGRVRADLMELDEAPLLASGREDRVEPNRGDSAERRAGLLAIRLNAVCPPSARRPHLQEGVLIGRYPSSPPEIDRLPNDFGPIVVAKLKLINTNGRFWSKRDYPIHSVDSLLPSAAKDPLLAELRAEMSQLHPGATLSGQHRD